MIYFFKVDRFASYYGEIFLIMLNIRAVIFIILFLIFLIPTSYAWNYTGHVLIAQIAYDQLSQEKKNKADALAETVFKQLPIVQQEKLDYQYPTASTFAKVAILPDVWRKWNLSTIFLKFHALPPMNLFFSLKEPTAGWHFIDTPFPSSSNCKLQDDKNVVWAINNLEKDLASSKLDSSKALELVFLEHYIGDIHQPLHTVTNVTNSCDGDRGGNNYCLKENRYGKCTKNLHSLWDSAVGYLKPHENIKGLAYELETLYPISQFQNKIDVSQANKWANENLSKMYFVYSTSQYVKPNKDYYQNGQAIAKKQIVLAGYRLAKEINQVL